MKFIGESALKFTLSLDDVDISVIYPPCPLYSEEDTVPKYDLKKHSIDCQMVVRQLVSSFNKLIVVDNKEIKTYIIKYSMKRVRSNGVTDLPEPT